MRAQKNQRDYQMDYFKEVGQEHNTNRKYLIVAYCKDNRKN